MFKHIPQQASPVLLKHFKLHVSPHPLKTPPPLSLPPVCSEAGVSHDAIWSVICDIMEAEICEVL